MPDDVAGQSAERRARGRRRADRALAAAIGTRRLSSGRRSRAKASRSTARAPRSRSTASPTPEAKGEDHRLAGGRADSAAPACSTSCGTGSSAGSATGASRSRSCTGPTARSVRWTRRICRWSCPRCRTSARRQRRPRRPAAPAAGPSARVVALRGDRRRPLRARAEHDAPVGGLVLVLPALPRSGQRGAVRGPRGRAVLDAARRRRAGMPGSRPASICTSAAAEHAVLHLLYARFWHKVLHDLGHVSTPEPFGRLFNQGYIQAHAYQDERGMYVEAAEVEARDGRYFHERQAGDALARQDGQEPQERGGPGRGVRAVRLRHHAPLRDVHGAARRLQALGAPRHHRHAPLPSPRVAEPRRRGTRRDQAEAGGARSPKLRAPARIGEARRRPTSSGSCTRRSRP